MAIHRESERKWTDISKADDILFFDVIFLLMVALFSAGNTTNFDLSQYTNQIFAPWPSAPPQPTVTPGNQTATKCVWYDGICQFNALLKSTTASVAAVDAPLNVLGAAIVWLIQIVFSFFNRLIIFGNLITFLMFNPALTGSGGVPFLPIIIVGLNVYVVWEVVRTFRGSSTGV